jgi:hypothetical protein
MWTIRANKEQIGSAAIVRAVDVGNIRPRKTNSDSTVIISKSLHSSCRNLLLRLHLNNFVVDVLKTCETMVPSRLGPNLKVMIVTAEKSDLDSAVHGLHQNIGEQYTGQLAL